MKKWIAGLIILVLAVPMFASAQATPANLSADIKGGRWSIVNAGGAAAQATATKAAGATGVRHVADCIVFGGASTAAPAAAALQVVIRDGASGAGTIIWTTYVGVNATAGASIPPFTQCGLNLAGTAATVMNVEFLSGLANLFESVTLTGYDQ